MSEIRDICVIHDEKIARLNNDESFDKEKNDLEIKKRKSKLCVDIGIDANGLLGIQNYFKDRVTGNIPEIKGVEKIKFSQYEYKHILSELFTNKDTFPEIPNFEQKVIHLVGGRNGGFYKGGRWDVIVLSKKNTNTPDKSHILGNELSHLIQSKFFTKLKDDGAFQSFQHLLPKELTLHSNGELSEFLSDVVSMAINPEQDFLRIGSLDQNNISLPSLKAEIELFVNKLSSNSPYKKKLADVLLMKDKELQKYVPMLKNLLKKHTPKNYRFTINFFRYMKKQQPNMSPKEMQKEYWKLGKSIITYYDKHLRNKT